MNFGNVQEYINEEKSKEVGTIRNRRSTTPNPPKKKHKRSSSILPECNWFKKMYPIQKSAFESDTFYECHMNCDSPFQFLINNNHCITNCLRINLTTNKQPQHSLHQHFFKQNILVTW